MGYDPIFKSQPGPAAIQPAPSAAPSMPSSAATSSPYPPPPLGYIPAVSQQPYAPSLGAGIVSPDSSVEPYDYSAAIDPALQGAPMPVHHPGLSYDGCADSSRLGGTPTHTHTHTRAHWAADRDRGHFVAHHHHHHPPAPRLTLFSTAGRPMEMQELVDVGGVPAPALTITAPLPASIVDDVKGIYNNVYAPGIDKFLETRWFTTRGWSHLAVDIELLELWATLINRFSIVPVHDKYGHSANRSLEARVLWSSMALCRRVSNGGQNGNPIEVAEGVHEAAKKVDIYETLVTNRYFDVAPLPLPSLPTTTTGAIVGTATLTMNNMNNGTTATTTTKLDEQLNHREREFWRLLGLFLTLHDDEAAAAQEIDETLNGCRLLLDSRENRDVLYSVAIVRHLGQRLAEGGKVKEEGGGNVGGHGNGNGNGNGGVNNDEQDPRTKFLVARTFVQAQADGKGMTQTVQRLCDVVIRSWGGGGGGGNGSR